MSSASSCASPPASCLHPPNSTVAENCRPGAPSTEWDANGAGDPSIQGFATKASVARGELLGFKVDTDAPWYDIDIYRLGYYGGLGARHVAHLVPTAPLPQSQPACAYEAATRLVDCGNWAVSATWRPPANATSGLYIARLTRPEPPITWRHDNSQAAPCVDCPRSLEIARC
jgi:hypothetical protein